MAALLGLSASWVYAGAGTDGAAFLMIPIGAEPAAMGGAYTALASDAYAPVWNPSGLGNIKSVQIAGQHLSYIDTLHYEFLSFAVPLYKVNECAQAGSCLGSAIGGSIQYLGSGDINGLESDGITPNKFSSYYTAYNLSYGRAIDENLSLGITGKLISAKLADASAQAYAADLGGRYRLDSHWTLAATVNNLGSKLKFINEGDPLPLAGHLGASFHPDAHWLLSAEGVFAKTGENSLHAGLEWRPVDMLALRGGYRTDTLRGLSAIAGASLGMGISLWGQELSYAWLPYGDLGDTHYISLMMKFGEDEQEKKNVLEYQHIKRHRTVENQNPQEMSPDNEELMQLLKTEDRAILGEARP
jgi:hypothetical protein